MEKAKEMSKNNIQHNEQKAQRQMGWKEINLPSLVVSFFPTKDSSHTITNETETSDREIETTYDR